MHKNYLPSQYQFSHDYCFFLHDQLLETLKSGEDSDIFSHFIKIDDCPNFPEERLSGEEVVDWLEGSDKKADLYFFYYKQIVAALLSDMLHFVYEALRCSEKGKLTVTYALLRKPLKENLFYLEWLLADPGEMLKSFDSEDSTRALDSMDSEKKRDIIRRAMNNTGSGEWINHDFIYDLRFDKKCLFGYERAFQQANHLVTTYRHLATEKTNFNFVFSGEDSVNSQWEGLYSFLPLLLFHAVEIIEGLVSKFAKRKDVFDLTPIRTVIGMMFCLQECPHNARIDHIIKDVRKLISQMSLRCSHCGALIDFHDNNLLELYQSYQIICDKCNYNMDFMNFPHIS
jgi:hypothetical protein